jgi:ABC-type multidrug transport system fused ATPase/permease subunit
MALRLLIIGLVILFGSYVNWITPVRGQGCRQVCDNAYPNNISFECPEGIGGTWEPLDPSYQCENNSTLACEQLFSTVNNVNTSVWSIQCGCADGWTGQTCGMCTEDSVCAENDTIIDCDKTPAPFKRKIIECYPQDQVVKNIFGQGTISYIYDVDKAEATILLWKRQEGQPVMSNCTMTGCTVMSQDSNTVFHCDAITCSCNPDPRLVNCSSLANSFLLSTVKGESTFTCENKENPICKLNQVNIPLEVTLTCTAAECGKSLGVATITQADRITGIIVGGVVIPIGVGICLVTPFVVYVIRKKLKRPYNEVITSAVEGCTLELKDVQYKVKIRSGKACQKKEEAKKIILHKVNMKIYPGQICAVMGSSGSGKTTLLDIISHVGKRGVVTGKILMDGKPLPKYFKRIAG